MSHISFYTKLLGQRSAGKPHAALDVAGAGDVPLGNAPVLDPSERDWEGRAFGMAIALSKIALSKDGHYDWEDFRQGLMGSIAKWEGTHALDDTSWDYYQRWLGALEQVLVAHGVVNSVELEARTAAVLEGLETCETKATNST
ncbi:MAG: nitrile hydratase accessory protein [Proteobacteria bacterium]|nr:nitrile hydratase accessory protein [Pseudomonadota bacterium]